MTLERQSEIKNEAVKRVNLWLSAKSFDDMSFYGSFMRFNMALGLFGGYPFEKEKWMKKNDFNGFVTEDEFDSPQYDEIIDELFYKASGNKLIPLI